MTVGLLEGLATTRAIRRYTEAAMSEADLAEILWHAGRAPSGTLQPWGPLRPHPIAARRAGARSVGAAAPPPASRSASSSCASTVVRRSRWQAALRRPSRTGAGGRAGRARAVSLGERLRGGVGVPGVPEPAPRCPCARLRRGADDVAPGRRGGAARHCSSYPTHVALSACITLGVLAGHHGPLRRKPLAQLVHDGRWGRAATWLGDRADG